MSKHPNQHPIGMLHVRMLGIETRIVGVPKSSSCSIIKFRNDREDHSLALDLFFLGKLYLGLGFFLYEPSFKNDGTQDKIPNV